MIDEVLSILYFFVPAYVANMAPVFFRRMKWFSWPLDFGSKFRGKSLFGENKTWRGLILGVFFGMLAFWFQQWGYAAGFTAWSIIEYTDFHVLLGAAIGFGALIGDALESFVKRQRGIPPGKAFVPWDQLDFMLGAMIVSVPYWLPLRTDMLIALAVIFVLNLLIQKFGYWTGLKKDPL